MKAHLMEGKDVDSGYLTIDRILYIPNFFSIINTSTNHFPNFFNNHYSVSITYCLMGREDLPKNLAFFEHIIKKGSDGGYNDGIKYLGETDVLVTEEELIGAMKDTHLVTSEEAHEAYTEYSRKTHELWEQIRELDEFERMRDEELYPEYVSKISDKISPKLQKLVERLKPVLGDNIVPRAKDESHWDSVYSDTI